MKAVQLLKKQYLNETDGWKVVLFISAFLTLFLLLFRPFGIDSSNSSVYMQSVLSHGLVTLVSLIVNVFILPLIFKSIFSQEKWNVFKQFLWFLWNVVTIGLSNYIFAKIASGHFGLNFMEILTFITNSLLISIIPISFLTLIDYNRSLRKSLAESESINSTLASFHQKQNTQEQKIRLDSSNKKNLVLTSSFNLLFVESQGNYVKVWFLEDKKLQSKVLRSTLKSIENQLSEFPNILKVHRAFIINTNHVISVSGNSQGSKVKLNATDKEIIIARSYIKAFKNVIEKIV